MTNLVVPTTYRGKEMEVIQVRLDGKTETAVRLAAEQMGVQVNRIKIRDDCVQLYGTVVIK
jgi:hypothetical protein